MNFGSYFFSDKIALRCISAQPVTPERESGGLRARRADRARSCAAHGTSHAETLPDARADSPNAFATGRNPQHASVAFTAGILQLMNDQRDRRRGGA